MIRRWLDSLSPIEREAVWPVSSIEERKIDVGRSSIEQVAGFSVLRLKSVFDEHCPFELYVGDFRGPPQHDRVRFNFFVGAGADFANFEDVSEAKDRAGVSEDIRGFLESSVRCVRERDADMTVIREDLWIDELVINGSPIQVGWTAPRAPWMKRRERTEEIVYSPWVLCVR